MLYNIIYKHVQKEHSNYGPIELGDARARNLKDLKNLALQKFDNSEVTITKHILYFRDYPSSLARKVARFFYASYVLSIEGYKGMLIDLEKYFSYNLNKGLGCYIMPVNRIYIIKNN